ncbi:hypothetical protein RhiirA5_420649 [Rhizophagus irregularis]|uniref:Uncharacterized protein n=1 Tax=Rhizophagus irregularis TaxID=588596 RepID=A0A2I1EVZ7_9GLOM|nr:hypothetical protein RhiirA5_420649 [Rhizophagus irregularis]PKY26290.1 hypothetical protein RhiirB3_441545 [Rhizophagus irregularis]
MVSHLKEYTLFKKENKFSKFNIKDSDDKDRWNINVIEGKLVDKIYVFPDNYADCIIITFPADATGWIQEHILADGTKHVGARFTCIDLSSFSLNNHQELVNINRDDVISILGNADVTHGNGTEASDFDMRIGAEASHYFVYGKNANYASVEVELIERYGFKSYTGTIIPVLTNAILENPVDEVYPYESLKESGILTR